MPFKRKVQVGRICLINAGPNKGKLVAIVDIVDTARILVDSPALDIERQVMHMKYLSVTPIVIPLPRGSRQKNLIKVWNEAKVDETWEKTEWAKKLAVRAKRADMSDFDRFKKMILKRKARSVFRKEFAAVKKEQ